MSIRRVRASEIRAWKSGTPFPMLTAYDAAFARICEEAGIEVLLVGDSYGMVSLGLDGTSGVELEDMIRASAAVVRGTARAHVCVDLPFGSYEASDELAAASAARLIKYGMAGSVKMEGDVLLAPRARAIAAAGIPVIGHIGVRPQTAAFSTGYRSQTDLDRLLADARAFEQAGAFAIVLEKIDPKAAETLTRELAIPTIGIGSGPHCDGQVLVLHDVLGLFPKPPPFAKKYETLAERAVQAIRTYGTEVRERQFP